MEKYRIFVRLTMSARAAAWVRLAAPSLPRMFAHAAAPDPDALTAVNVRLLDEITRHCREPAEWQPVRPQFQKRAGKEPARLAIENRRKAPSALKGTACRTVLRERRVNVVRDRRHDESVSYLIQTAAGAPVAPPLSYVLDQAGSTGSGPALNCALVYQVKYKFRMHGSSSVPGPTWFPISRDSQLDALPDIA
jgi:hypothetical protein